MAYFYYNHVEKSKKTLNYFILAYEKEKNYICASMISHLYIILNDKNEAFKWAFKAASFHGKSKWLSHNHTTMGDFYKNGIGTAKNINEALKWYIKDEEFLKIANIYYLGKDKPENIDEAVKYYKKVLDVEINYAKQKCECQNYDGYIQEMLYNNDAGWASYALCRIFYNKNNKNYNVKIALDYLKESANIYKNGLALRSLGKEYEIGLNFLKNEKKAFELYYESAIRNSDFGQYELGRCYLNGIGTDKNYNKAAHWFKLSHDNGNEEAKSMWDKYELWKYYEEIDENTKMEK
jgi:TPR repeat protein